MYGMGLFSALGVDAAAAAALFHWALLLDPTSGQNA